MKRSHLALRDGRHPAKFDAIADAGALFVARHRRSQVSSTAVSSVFLSRTCDAHVDIDDTICYCFHVRKRKILNFIRIHQPRRASQISECGGAGTGCGWCVPYLTRYFDEAQQAGRSQPDDMTPAEYARLRADYIRDGKGVPPPGAIPLPSGEDGPAP